MALTDIHCHLYSVDDFEGAVREALEAGVDKALVVSEKLDSMEEVLRMRDRFPDFVLPGLGIHPAESILMSEDEWKLNLSFLAAHAEEAVAVGEIGLDFKIAEDEAARDRQRGHLHDQMAVAADHGLPVNLHSRRALRQTMEEAVAFRERTGLHVLLHWFAHSKKLLRRTNEAGLFVSAGPSVLSSEQALDVALTVDLGLILVETDTPVPFGGRSARPAWAADVAALLVEQWQDGLLTTQRLDANARTYLGEGALT